MVVWMTGLSGAGKTTLSQTIARRIKPRLPQLVCLDGDAVRAAFGHNLGYAESERIKQVRRLQAMAKLLAEQRLSVMVAVLYVNPTLLAWNRDHLPDYFEIHLNASLNLVRARDPKGLYAGAESGRIPDVVGVDIPYHPPSAPDLVLDADSGATPDQLADQVIRAVPWFRATEIAAA